MFKNLTKNGIITPGEANMRKRTNILLLFVLVSGLLVITSNLLINPVTGHDGEEYETDPHDPGNTNGPGFYESNPCIFGDFELLNCDNQQIECLQQAIRF